ncbi:hypothetical protein GTZ99_08270 [Novosphingobium sp. FSY-8]|uniref:Dolichyl-phosphate-mannose-protein mannosyltransferase n=1 Tax=Novosphingobium ovatum TaxID=1908523 RepID=A0ABW9XDF2_9SPHN|nr:hypothetical protein [Novosphingobium ovatum]
MWAQSLLIALAGLFVASALVPITVGRGEEAKPPSVALIAGDKAAQAVGGTGPGAGRVRDDDLKLYDTAISRIRHGENYYDFIVQEQRNSSYPVRPGVAVRLPTLAYLNAAMGVDGDASAPVAMAAAIALMLGVIWAWRRRLADEGATESQLLFGTALVFLGASLGLNRYYFVLHELWAGMLIALALGLHRVGDRGRGGRWIGAWAAAALALAIREHALPFVLLMAAMAAGRALVWRGTAGGRAALKEATAWGLLIALFAGALAWHLSIIAAQVRPTDPMGPSWLALRGLGGWLSNIVLSSNLRFLPHYLAGPVVMAMMLGWAGWRSAAGLTATLLFAGYGVMFMVVGRNDNFYWGAMIAPAMFAGLAFVPMAATSLVKAARPR